MISVGRRFRSICGFLWSCIFVGLWAECTFLKFSFFSGFIRTLCRFTLWFFASLGAIQDIPLLFDSVGSNLRSVLQFLFIFFSHRLRSFLLSFIECFFVPISSISKLIIVIFVAVVDGFLPRFARTTRRHSFEGNLLWCLGRSPSESFFVRCVVVPSIEGGSPPSVDRCMGLFHTN